MKKVLLTGGTGLVGSDIMNALLQKGYRVYAISRKLRKTNNLNLTWINADLGDISKSFFKKIPKIDIVIHVAASVDIVNPRDELKIYLSDMYFSEKLFDWCSSLSNAKSLVVVFISGLNFLKKPLQKKITEIHPICPETPYGVSKYWGELSLFKNGELGGYRSLAFRLSSPISFDFKLLHNTVVKKWINCALKKDQIKIFGKGLKTQDFVATVDVAHAIIEAINNLNARGVYNIASGKEISMIKLSEIINSKIPVDIIHIKNNEKNYEEHWNISINKAKKDFNYNPKYSSEEIIETLLDRIVL